MRCNFILSRFKPHFIDDSNGDFIRSLGGYIECKINNNNYYLDLYPRIISFFALSTFFRRLFRLNRINVKLLINKNLLIIANRKLYIYDSKKNSLIFKFKFPFTRYVHNETISIVDNRIVVGEYGASKKKYDIGVFYSDNFGDTWKRETLFQKGFTKNILSVYFDSIQNKYWIATGDDCLDSHIYNYSYDFNNRTYIGGASLKYRAISFCFFIDNVVWLMNNPFGESNVIIYSRIHKNITIGQELPGPVWYSTKIGNLYFATTAAENTQNGYNSFVSLIKSQDFIHWEEYKRFNKDWLPKKLFLSGLLTFPDVNKPVNKIHMYADAIKKYDGKYFTENI